MVKAETIAMFGAVGVMGVIAMQILGKDDEPFAGGSGYGIPSFDFSSLMGGFGEGLGDLDFMEAIAGSISSFQEGFAEKYEKLVIDFEKWKAEAEKRMQEYRDEIEKKTSELDPTKDIKEAVGGVKETIEAIGDVPMKFVDAFGEFLKLPGSAVKAWFDVFSDIGFKGGWAARKTLDEANKLTGNIIKAPSNYDKMLQSNIYNQATSFMNPKKGKSGGMTPSKFTFPSGFPIWKGVPFSWSKPNVPSQSYINQALLKAQGIT